MIENVKHGEEVFFSQNDERDEFIKMPYWEGDIKDSGCGMMSFTVCVDLLTGKDYTPADIYRMRQEAGLDQRRMVDRLGTAVCGGDVQFQLNEINSKLFGIKSMPLDRTVEAFKEALERPNTVIWASSRNTDFFDMNDEPRFVYNGHVIAFWKYEDGYFYVKDSHYVDKALGNNVKYSEERLKKWFEGYPIQQFAVTLAPTSIAEIMKKMIKFSGRNLHDISHLQKVHEFAKLIAECEGTSPKDQRVIEMASIVHDIACPLCREKYGNTDGKHQEIEGEALVHQFFKDLNVSNEEVERVAYLVAHHHTLTDITGKDYQILIEADYLVNADESQYSKENIRNMMNQVFKTRTGKELLESIYLKEDDE